MWKRPLKGDFREKSSVPDSISIEGEPAERVNQYKYHGVFNRRRTILSISK